jgi:hypothetical protein
MIAWGGYDGSCTNTGGKYNPSTDTWSSVSGGTDVPSGRNHHTAIWTGIELIVWGGRGSIYLNSGGRYNPLTDFWILTSIGPNVPFGRDGHTAVWTGTEMIVWGGNCWDYEGNQYYYLNTGGRYNPSTDSWIATSIESNVPSARKWHTAVWTKTEMIVWGGIRIDNSNEDEKYSYFNTGGRYNPLTDSWAFTSTGENVPLARCIHSSIWTGKEMIIWGGYDINGACNTGGKYDITIDSWIPTSTGVSVPSGRGGHTAVWTGKEMIIWGGWIPEEPHITNMGGKYTPATDSWTSTSTGNNVPTGRDGHTAVWTGIEMLVWGGHNFGSLLASGGTYRPGTEHDRPVSPP